MRIRVARCAGCAWSYEAELPAESKTIADKSAENGVESSMCDEADAHIADFPAHVVTLNTEIRGA